MRQVIYRSISTAASGLAADDAPEILKVAKALNGVDGITGILYIDGQNFLQVIEGEAESIAGLLERLLADPRHMDIAILSDTSIDEREFGDWTMVQRDPVDDIGGFKADDFDERMRVLLFTASPQTVEHFSRLALAA
ncbi:BLUF domain-containing protein [Sphingomonas sp. CL5.1]|uniref:BLUF domain-containing protein n=1 Tax=Sphingomonas sp. CL5.1 TaxID=2653203 RepID=UPI0015836BAF|nr:BLUF domain-containing protein [Sphingomonas sp. CL5.1]QKR99660.1 BLUF domain-containing protein [Sphingomonas sp. CL5.1]